MTDKDRLSAIKIEVERRKEINKNFDSSDAYMRGVMACYSEVLAIFEFDEFKEEPVSEDLEEAASRYAALQAGMKDAMTSEYYEEYPYSPNDIKAFKAGANWKEQQLMAKAVDTEVHIDSGGYPYIPQMELYDYEKDIPLAKRGDKVKILIVKES